MKKHKKSKEDNVGCFVQSPPWVIAKTKQEAYHAGVRSGCEEGQTMAKRDQSQRLAFLEREAVRVEYKALSDICQAGSLVVEAMSKALLSVKGHL